MSSWLQDLMCWTGLPVQSERKHAKVKAFLNINTNYIFVKSGHGLHLPIINSPFWINRKTALLFFPTSYLSIFSLSSFNVFFAQLLRILRFIFNYLTDLFLHSMFICVLACLFISCHFSCSFPCFILNISVLHSSSEYMLILSMHIQWLVIMERNVSYCHEDKNSTSIN